MKVSNIYFPLDKFEKLIIKIGWDSLQDWISFWNYKKDILLINEYWNDNVREDWIWGLALPLLSQAYKYKNKFSDRKIIGISALPGTGKTTLKLSFNDIASNHFPNVVLPVPGKAEIPIIFLSEKFCLKLYA